MVCGSAALLNYSLFTIHFSLFTISVPVAQLDRASDSDSEGRAFESHQAR